MLFTGDAFELSQGLKKMQKLRNAVDSIALERVGTLDYYDFTVPPQAKSSKGNLLEWLSGTKEMNQKVNVNVLKVPHHGSRMTTDPSLFYYVTANVYLISGSLQVHAHPAFSTLRAMVRYAWAKDGSTPAKAPSKYRSQATSLVAELTESIEKVRLVLARLEISLSSCPYFVDAIFTSFMSSFKSCSNQETNRSRNLAIKTSPCLSVIRHS